MKRTLAGVAGLIGLVVDVSFGQPVAERPAFEVASIKAHPVGTPFPSDGGNGFKLSPNGVAWRYARLLFCLSWAYDIPGRVDGPEWIKDRYDIAGKAAGATSEAQLRLMVQTLLEDRFKLKVHRETRELPITVLTAAKNGPKNLEAIDPGGQLKYEPANGKLVFQGSLSNFANVLSNSPPYGVREKVMDQTGISGVFSFALKLGDFDVNDPAFGGKYDEMQSAAFAFLSSALERQYGLKLEHRKVPLECLVADGGNRTPTGN